MNGSPARINKRRCVRAMHVNQPQKVLAITKDGETRRYLVCTGCHTILGRLE